MATQKKQILHPESMGDSSLYKRLISKTNKNVNTSFGMEPINATTIQIFSKENPSDRSVIRIIGKEWLLAD